MPGGEAVGVPAPTARRSDPETSHEAARLKSGTGIASRLMQIQANTVEFFPTYMVVTNFHDSDLAGWCDEERGIVARDRGLLVEAGYVEPARDGVLAKQLTTMGPRGRNVLLWRITRTGIAEARRLKELLDD